MGSKMLCLGMGCPGGPSRFTTLQHHTARPARLRACAISTLFQNTTLLSHCISLLLSHRLQAMSGIPTPEEPASPPSTPVAGMQAAVPVPVPVTLPIEPMEPPSPPSASAPEPTSVPQPHMADAAPGVAQMQALPAASAASAAVGSPLDDRPQRPAPRLLTPGEVAQQVCVVGAIAPEHRELAFCLGPASVCAQVPLTATKGELFVA